MPIRNFHFFPEAEMPKGGGEERGVGRDGGRGGRAEEFGGRGLKRGDRQCSRKRLVRSDLVEGSDDEPVARTFLGEQVVLFRGANGTPAALEDRCCHRAAPLSLGTVEGDICAAAITA